MRWMWNFFVRFLVFGVIGWWPAWRGIVAEQRNMAERGRISQRQYARTVARMVQQESLYAEVNVYYRMQGLAWGITALVAAVQVYPQIGSLCELWGSVYDWACALLLVRG